MNDDANNRIDAKEVARFLNSNPLFFEQFPELIERISLPHPNGEKTVSLSERQILTLREKNNELESKLDELISYGASNDEIGKKMHLFSLALVKCKNHADLFENIHLYLSKHFTIPKVALRVWSMSESESGTLPDFVSVGTSHQSFADSLEKPYCGSTHGLDVSSWFGEVGDQEINSQALITLKTEEQSLGMIALGSDDPSRFYENMGTLHLEHLGELISAALERIV